MEFEGEKFAQNVRIKQEIAEKNHELDELKSKLGNDDMQQSNIPNQPYPPYNDYDDPVMVDVPEQELGDLILDEENNDNDKKKYIILGLALLLLFVLTILIIKLMGSFDDTKNENSLIQPQQETIGQDQALDNDEIEKQYQNIIKKKMEEIKQEEQIQDNTAVAQETETPAQQPQTTNLEEKSEEIIQKLKTEEKVLPDTPIVPKKEAVVVPKKHVTQKPAVTDFSQSVSNVKPTGVYVQIGAFSKEPNKKFMDNIVQNGYKYKLYSVEIKDKTYVKVLVGPFDSSAQAKEELPNIKARLNANSAYVIQF